ncbi:hypothetical protein MAPG_10712 [Magnaporthiopsis poae ATCC 64411]|uniref:Nudix hydrolase domain-containing protein n=1 Tax=Magnaporthiopsis poae (strain ATCC 64411 / 73-15) TaxID=644358 RepID=A0A0C4EDB7_MAGP6|nr:hypothetical protein MAPG_10712 [Magnaporthiopsis poae ATCC 64411]
MHSPKPSLRIYPHLLQACFRQTPRISGARRRTWQFMATENAHPQGGPVDPHVLGLTAAEFRKLRPSPSGKPFDKVVVGAAIIRHAAASGPGDVKTPTILLLKRAAHEIYYPDVFELPSGKVDPEDRSIRDALAREVHEETGLEVADVVAELQPMVYETTRTVTDGAGLESSVTKSAIQLNYVVSVAGDAEDGVTLRPEEHSESCWATETVAGTLDVTALMMEVVREAFRWVSRSSHTKLV